MKELKKSVEIAGKVLGLFLGDNYTSPYAETVKNNPFLPFTS